MPKLYSYDLRQKVIQAIKLNGLKIIKASLIFNIGRNTHYSIMAQAAAGNGRFSSVA